jgi:hypothetical protein
MVGAGEDGSPAGCDRNPIASGRGLLLAVLFFVLCSILTGCGDPDPMRVALVVGGEKQALEVTAQYLSVRGLLEAMEVTLGPQDRVEPDLYVEVTEGLTVTCHGAPAAALYPPNCAQRSGA